MTFQCPVCFKSCCECQGCKGILLDGKWVCPNCVGRFQTPRQMVQQGSNNNITWQVITNHIRKQ